MWAAWFFPSFPPSLLGGVKADRSLQADEQVAGLQQETDAGRRDEASLHHQKPCFRFNAATAAVVSRCFLPTRKGSLMQVQVAAV